MTTEFLWGKRAQPTRGPKPGLSLDRIAAAAIEIADAEGLAAVSMQRVAADLGFTKMSLYRYLPGKADLVALMVERAIGEPPTVETRALRTGLKEWSQGLLAAYLRHPWAVGSYGARSGRTSSRRAIFAPAAPSDTNASIHAGTGSE